MKKLLLIFVLYGTIANASAQEKLKTTVFTLDLGNPKPSSLTCSDTNVKHLILNSNHLLSFKLNNANPFKYTYTINSTPVDFFNNSGYNPLDSVNRFLNQSVPPEITRDSSTSTSESLLKTYSNIAASLAVSYKPEKINITRSNINDIKAQLHKSNFIDLDSGSNNIASLEKLIKKNNATSNIFSAFEILLSKSKSLVAELKSYTNKIATEDFLLQEDFKNKRSDLNSQNIQLHRELSNLNAEASQKLDDENLKKYKEKLTGLTTETTKINQEIERLYQVKLYN